LFVVKTAPPLTPTIPKPGALGMVLAHWGKLMSKPVSPDAGVPLAAATTDVASDTTTAKMTATADFERGTCT
jgi:hypothetical protein